MLQYPILAKNNDVANRHTASQRQKIRSMAKCFALLFSALKHFPFFMCVCVFCCCLFVLFLFVLLFFVVVVVVFGGGIMAVSFKNIIVDIIMVINIIIIDETCGNKNVI